ASVACTLPATFDRAVDQMPRAAAIRAAIPARTTILRIVSPSAACERRDCRRRQSGGNPTQLVRHERRRGKAIRQKVNHTPNGCASLVIRADERRRLKAIRQKYNRDPNGGLAVGSVQEMASSLNYMPNRRSWRD